MLMLIKFRISPQSCFISIYLIIVIQCQPIRLKLLLLPVSHPGHSSVLLPTMLHETMDNKFYQVCGMTLEFFQMFLCHSNQNDICRLWVSKNIRFKYFIFFYKHFSCEQDVVWSQIFKNFHYKVQN